MHAPTFSLMFESLLLLLLIIIWMASAFSIERRQYGQITSGSTLCLNPHYLAAPCRGKQTPAACQEQSISRWSSIAGRRDEYYTLSYRGVSGCLVPLGTYTGCKWREGVTHLLLLRGVTSRLISFHFLSFHPRASAASAKCMCVCM